MPYCTIADISRSIESERLAQWTDDANGRTPDNAIVAAAIAAADGLIDSYCSAKYSTPFNPVPDVIKDASIIIAIKRLASRRSFTLDETRQKAHDEIIAWLRDVARGLANVTGAQQPTPAAQAQGTYSVEDRMMTKTKLQGF